MEEYQHKPEDVELQNCELDERPAAHDDLTRSNLLICSISGTSTVNTAHIRQSRDASNRIELESNRRPVAVQGLLASDRVRHGQGSCPSALVLPTSLASWAQDLNQQALRTKRQFMPILVCSVS